MHNITDKYDISEKNKLYITYFRIKKKLRLYSIAIFLLTLKTIAMSNPVNKQNDKSETATFGAGCFWCVEAIFERVNGVKDVQSGYSGGHVKNPTYKEVCTGTTGHAEVCRITYDPEIISYPDLLEIFWQTHDPTTPNRQGNDVGTQYRSVIFYHNNAQKNAAVEMKKRLNKAGIWKNPVVTQIVPLEIFYPAEDYHEDYYSNNPDQPYCSFIISPKVKKFEKAFGEYLKPNGE
ncbi:MAG: peptide-methionine (S)-S-oxide reductase MsrA [Bacteroidales bacterium]|nr:peptide-methionine (S)-S-oxide reductase MsrA [Bacteroidales bacterium]